jgi:hypothetical protein
MFSHSLILVLGMEMLISMPCSAFSFALSRSNKFGWQRKFQHYDVLELFQVELR